MRGTSVLASAILAAVLVFGGLWALDNTSIGLRIKCQVFRDVGACFVVALTEPVAPTVPGPLDQAPPTETPEQRAAREAAEEQERRDQAVRDASAALGRAIDDLTSNADDLTSGAADMAATVSDVRDSVNDGMKSSYSDLVKLTKVQPMDDVAQGDVCVGVGDVEVARGDVDVAGGDFEVAEGPYDAALEDRSGYVAAVQSAMADLQAAEAANPDGLMSGSSTAPFTVDDGQAAIASADQAAQAAAAKAAKAKADVAALVKSADAIMSKANKLGRTVGGC